MKPGEGSGYFLADLAAGLSDEELRRRWNQGEYGKGSQAPRPDFVKG